MRHQARSNVLPSAGGGFAQLQCLNLGNNIITGWAAVDALSGLPALSELRLSGNPLLPAAAPDARYEVLTQHRAMLRMFELLRQ